MSERIRLGVIYGGKSSEHEVSLCTALSVLKAVDMNTYDIYPIYITLQGDWVVGAKLQTPPGEVDELRLAADEHRTPSLFQLRDALDIVFPVVHGPYGEDGTLQGLLEMLDIPYVGSGVLGSAVGMDKVLMKKVYTQIGLPQVKYVSYLRSELEQREAEIVEETANEIGFPCFVKPANMGSSVGISKVKAESELLSALAYAAKFDRKLIVEQGIEGRELEVAVLGNETPQTSCVGEIISVNEFYDYEAKYKNAGTKLCIPAEVPPSVVERIKEYAQKAFQAIDCFGLARVDFFWDERTDRVYINEINTMPGFTPVSMYPMLWQESGVSYPELINRLVELGFSRYRDRKANEAIAERLD